MKVLVTGLNGQLGYDVVKRLEQENINHLGIDKDIVDITDEQLVKKTVREYMPDVIIHCAAYTAVDQAEDEKELCYAINVMGTKYVVEACKEIDAKLVYISTDYVFDGEGDKPFEVTDKPNPINYYGQTKYEGELVVQNSLEKFFIIRISWLFGSNGNNFVKTMLKLGKERKELSVVSNQIGSPTYSYDLAELIVEMIQTTKYGIYHATNEGYCSWYEFACEIFKRAGMDVNVKAVSTDQYPTRAKRPKNSRLSKEFLYGNGFEKLGRWETALENML